MDENIFALLVHDREEPLGSLRNVLESQGVHTSRAKDRQDVLDVILSSNCPQTIFTDISLADTTWAGILSLAEKAPKPLPVIVVARIVDVELYVTTIELGAYDFIVPPFKAVDIMYMLRGAVRSASNKEKTRGLAWQAGMAPTTRAKRAS